LEDFAASISRLKTVSYQITTWHHNPEDHDWNELVKRNVCQYVCGFSQYVYMRLRKFAKSLVPEPSISEVKLLLKG